jgi:hypothetical protein
MDDRYYFVWDYNLSKQDFLDILEGRLVKGRLDQNWAMIRLLEYGKYEDIIRLLGYRNLVLNWPKLRSKIQFDDRRRGFDFLVKWLPDNHPELLEGKK